MASKKNERKRAVAKKAAVVAKKKPAMGRGVPGGQEYPDPAFGQGKVVDRGVKR